MHKLRFLLGKMLGEYSENKFKECDETIEEILALYENKKQAPQRDI